MEEMKIPPSDLMSRVVDEPFTPERLMEMTGRAYDLLGQLEEEKARHERTRSELEDSQKELAYYRRECTCNAFKHAY